MTDSPTPLGTQEAAAVRGAMPAPLIEAARQMDADARGAGPAAVHPATDPANAHQRPGNADGGPSLPALSDPPGGMSYVPSDAALTNLSASCPAGADLVKSWGADGPINIAMVQSATGSLLSGMSPDGVRHMLAAIDGLSGPDFARLHHALASHGRQIASVAGDPSSIRRGVKEMPGTPTDPAAIADLDRQIAEFDEKYFAVPLHDRLKRDRMAKEREALYARRFGTGPIVGASGRTL